MFTGLVEELGKVRAVSRGARSIRLTISAARVLADVKLGDSIAVDGACLTVVEHDNQAFTADIMPETFDRTTLSERKPGDVVNLERTLRVGDRLGGHIVAGHVDGVGKIESVTRLENANILKIHCPEELAPFCIPQGSVALDGVSLTIVDCGNDWLSVSLIPHTRDVTILSLKKPGDRVNIETDVLGKYIYRMLAGNNRPEEKKTPFGQDFLAKHGFLE